MHRASPSFQWTRDVLIVLVALGLAAGRGSPAAWSEEPELPQEAPQVGTPTWLERWSIRGRLKEEIAYRLSDPNQFTKVKTIGWLDGRYEISSSVSLRLAGRGWYDGAYELTEVFPANVERDQKVDLDLRQALLSASAGGFDIRLGRQQIVWGEAIGTFITDVVNPKDFREFVLSEFSEIRIPLWALDLTYTLGKDLVIEGVWTPDLRFNKLPEPGAEFEFFRQPLPPNIRLERQQKPPVPLGNSQGGVRLSYLLSGWDLSALYYDAFDPTPVFFRRPTDAFANGSPVFALTPRHPRLHMMGATLGKSIEPVVIRAELLYTLGKLFSTTAPDDPDGVVRSDTLDYLLSLDYTFFGKLDTTWQFSQKILMGSADVVQRGAVQGRATSAFAVRLATGFLDNKLNPSALVVVNVNDGDSRISPKLDYLLTGALTLTLGADVFAGPQETLYGQFAKKDRLYVELDYRL